MTEGARATKCLVYFTVYALSLTRLRRDLLGVANVVSSEGAFDMCGPKVGLLFLTSTAFVDTKSEAPRKAGLKSLLFDGKPYLDISFAFRSPMVYS